MNKDGFENGGPTYTCGDPYFKYPLDDAVSGPHYTWSLTPYYSDNYFKIISKQAIEVGLTPLDLKSCDFLVMDTIIEE